MTANKGNQKKKAPQKPAQKPVKQVEEVPEAVEPVVQTEEVVSFEKDGEAKQAREKAKGKNKSAFVTWFKKADPIAMACFVAIILASFVILGSYISHAYFGPHHSPTVAGEGSTVEVQYVGSYIAYYDQNGAVIFDTNMESVDGNSDYIFSSTYTEKTSYKNYSFTIGGTSVLKAFGDACVGHSKGHVVKVAIPASDDAYGKVDTFSNATKTVSIDTNGSMSLAQFNKVCGTTYTESSFATPVTAGPITGIDFIATYDSGNDKVNYQFIIGTGVDADYTLAASDNAVHVKYVSATSFELTYALSTNGVYAGFCQGDSGMEPAFIDYRGGAGFTYWFNDLSDHAEQKGETMYFYIKIKSVN